MTEYGIQMYSLRDAAEKDLKAALKAVAQMGYASVEFAGFFGHSSREVRSWLDEFGLKVSGTHTGWPELTEENLDETIAYHKTIGNKRIIVPGGDFSTAEKLDDFIRLVNRVQPILAAEGIVLAYHNHSHEFVPNEDGQMIHEELQKRTGLLFQLDTFWVYNAGKDPVEMMEKLANRVPVIHLKDGIKGGEGRTLGKGEAPVAEVRRAALRLGMDMVVESETLNPDGPTESRMCIEWLKTQE